ncbi:hypothetical protein Pfo_028254 [Paulownia fortunei]|nr:hypothetical protein Pfo_028254 [Paulownia fortunei]
MDLPEAPASVAAATSSAGDYQPERRRTCTTGCGRPISVCLCHTLPSTPLPTATKVVILHHPTSAATSSPPSPSSPNASKTAKSSSDYSVGPNALPFVEVNQVYSSLDDVARDDLILIVFDGTWKHAKEMVLASLSFLSKFAIQVCLDFDVGADGGTIFDSELILRKEPFAGCMSTMEAVARCLRVLEPNGIDIESRIIEVLRAMVSFQACSLKPLRPRPKLMKNNTGKNEKNDSTDSLC